MTVFTVGTAAELTAALSQAAGGDKIMLQAGNYGDLALSGKTFSSDVTIQAATAGAPPVFSSIKMNGCANITFDGIKAVQVPTATTVEWANTIDVRSSSGITIQNSEIVGGKAVGGIDPSADPSTAGIYGVKGIEIGRGATFNGCSDVAFVGNKVTGFTYSVRFESVTGGVLANNEMSDFRRCALAGGDMHKVQVTGNLMHDPHPWKMGLGGDHADFIHIFTLAKQTTVSNDVLIADNFLDQGQGTGIMGIFLNALAGSKGFSNVKITDNFIHASTYQGIRAEGINGGSITSNTIIGDMSTLSKLPKIILAYGNSGLVVDKNISPGVSGIQLSSGHSAGILLGSNLSYQMTDPGKANYLGHLFADALNPHPTLASYHTKPGSLAEGLGATVGGSSPTTTGSHGGSGPTPTPTPVPPTKPGEPTTPLPPTKPLEPGHDTLHEPAHRPKDAVFGGRGGERGLDLVSKAGEKAKAPLPTKLGVELAGDQIKLPATPKAWDVLTHRSGDGFGQKGGIALDHKVKSFASAAEVHKLLLKMGDDAAAGTAPKLAAKAPADVATAHVADHLTFVDGHSPFGHILHG